MPPTAGPKTLLGTGKVGGTDLSAAAVARTKFMRANRVNWRTNHGHEYDPSASFHAPEEAFLGPWDARLEAEGPLYVEGALEQVLLSLMGDVTDSGGADPFTHTYKIADTVAASKSYLTAEKQLGSDANALVGNVAVNRLEVRGGSSAYLQYQLRAIASKVEILARTASPTLTTIAPCPGRHGTVFTLDAVTSLKVRSFSWFVDHHNLEDEYDLNSRFRKGAAYQEAEAGFEAEVIVEGLTELKKYLDSASATAPSDTASKGSTYAVSLKTTAATNRSIEWTAPKVFLEAGDLIHEGKNVYRQRIRGRALHNQTKAIEVITVNSVATP